MNVEQIKQEHFDGIKSRKVILIVKEDYGWNVELWTPTGVAPTTGYDTPQEAGARVLQLLGIKEPVTPQNWPEAVGLGPNPGAPLRPPRKIV